MPNGYPAQAQNAVCGDYCSGIAMNSVRSKRKRSTPLAGELFQRLVGIVEKSIAGESGYVVDLSKRLRDRDTGRLREHDVVLTHRHAHHELITSIECRERSRRIGVPEVEQFQKKCERTGVHRGVMVSQLGFTKTALKKAGALGIECLTLEEAETFSWCSMQHAVVQSPKVLWGRFIPFPEPAGVTQMALYARPNILIDQSKMMEIVQSCIADWRKTGDRIAGKYLVNFTLHGSEYYLVDSNKLEHPVERLTARIQFELIDTLSPLTFKKYQKSDGQAVAEVASAPIDFGSRKGRLMFVNQPGEGTEVLLAFD